MAGRLLRAGGGRLGVAALPRALLAASGPGLCPRRGCSPEEAAGEAEAALLALGFSRAQARRLRGLQPRLGPRRAAAAAEQLLLLGLSAEAALGLLERSPELLRAAEAQLKERAEYLRRLGLGGGHLQRVAGRCPQVFTLPRRRMEAAVRVLREKCLFTAEQLTEVLQSCPGVLLEEPGGLQYHFQYAYFRMGVRQKEMVKARLFRTPFAELRNRHIFLERRGLYQTPLKGQTQTNNPKLKEVLHLPEKEFLANLARATPEEYEVFKKLLAREEEEEEEKEEEEEEEEEDRDTLYIEGDKGLDDGSRRV
ncbi:transcription termination factor 4, mitochondrial [Anser cygnoides]|uniref:transcription termination factor 4, mitochondrial n=1 Tax=Anser cygnoides TaxID=8845 RepID=UPI0034D27CA5